MNFRENDNICSLIQAHIWSEIRKIPQNTTRPFILCPPTFIKPWIEISQTKVVLAEELGIWVPIREDLYYRRDNAYLAS